MYMGKRKKVIHTGFSLIVLIFVVLLLISFAAVSMTSAKADYQLSKKSADRTKKYYDVSNQVNEIIGEIDNFLAEQYAKGLGEEEYYSCLSDFQKKKKEIPIQVEKNRMTWEFPLQKDQVLEIELEILYPRQREKTFYKITKWKTIQKGDWEKEESIQVFQKDKLPFLEKEKE